MRYLVTGGAGFIGSNLTRALLAAGHRVRVLDNFLTGKRENLAGLAEAHVGTFELVEGDIRDPAATRKAVEGVEYVLHQGALPSVPRSVADPVLSNEINVAGTVNVLVAARDAGVRRVVFAASSSAYGDTPELPKRESMTPNPKSPYAAQKLAGEHYMRIFREVYGLETVSLRYFNVFGPRQDPKSMYAAVIPRFITCVMKGEPPTVYGDGLQTRDFTYIDNVVQANLAACAAPNSACGGVFNIACGERVSLLDILGIVYELAGKRVEPVFEPSRPGDVRDS
ncbi:MAG TPA: SDR family oxidoreductase, partial [Candidatus Deferrimicrobiaceae bacterium]